MYNVNARMFIGTGEEAELSFIERRTCFTNSSAASLLSKDKSDAIGMSLPSPKSTYSASPTGIEILCPTSGIGA